MRVYKVKWRAFYKQDDQTSYENEYEANILVGQDASDACKAVLSSLMTPDKGGPNKLYSLREVLVDRVTLVCEIGCAYNIDVGDITGKEVE